MPEFSGSLSSIRLAPLVRFICGLGKSGDLLLSHGHWIGQLSLEDGRLIAAAIENDEGESALDFISLALRDGDFEFSEGPPSLRPNIGPQDDPLLWLDEQALRHPAWLAALPSPTAIPHVVHSANDQVDSDVLVARSALYVLVDVDGVRSVRELALRHGLLRVVSSLATLRQLKLVEFGSVAVVSPDDRDDISGASGRRGQNSTASPPLQRPAAPGLRERTTSFQRLVVQRTSALIRSDHLQAVLATAVFVVLIRGVVQNFRVQGVSMQPSFNAGQVLVVNRAAYFHVDSKSPAAILAASRQGSTRYVFDGPQRGDIAVFNAPPEPDTDYIKRIIGLPGDSVLIRDGHVMVNGDVLEEPYVRFPADYTFPEGGRPLIVPDAQYFVLGDNRPESFDSHAGWFVPVDDLIGRAWIRYWPPDSLGVVAPGAVAMANLATR